VKIKNSVPDFVIPAKAGIQDFKDFVMPVPDRVRDKLAPA
jgi:hypothetical protein